MMAKIAHRLLRLCGETNGTKRNKIFCKFLIIRPLVFKEEKSETTYKSGNLAMEIA